jgi:hypothetical protein
MSRCCHPVVHGFIDDIDLEGVLGLIDGVDQGVTG